MSYAVVTTETPDPAGALTLPVGYDEAIAVLAAYVLDAATQAGLSATSAAAAAASQVAAALSAAAAAAAVPPFASPAEALAGTATDKIMSPARVADVLAGGASAASLMKLGAL